MRFLTGFLVSVFLIQYFLNISWASYVIELNDKFLDLKGDIPWLVEFYAPWCGYCRKLEPIYEEVGRRLSSSAVKVARIDATAYPVVASTYEIRGYPTIKYIKGDQVQTHYGDRSAERIIQFVEKAQGPAVRNLNEIVHFREALERHTNEPFFVYIGPEEDALHGAFSVVADSNHLKSYFYTGKTMAVIDQASRPVLRFLASGNDLPNGDNNGFVAAIKDEFLIPFTVSLEESAPSVEEQLRRWFHKERFPTLPKFSEVDLYEFMDGERLVALFVINETRLNEAARNGDRRVFQMAKKIAAARLPQLGDLQIGYMVDLAAASSLAMTNFLPPPNVIVVQPSTHKFYLREDYQIPWDETVDNTTVIQFLENVVQGNVKAYGGDSFFAKLHRAFFDLFTGLLSFVTNSPGIALLVLGIPISVVSFLVYAICCMDMADEKVDREARRRERAVERTQRSLRYEFPLEMRGSGVVGEGKGPSPSGDVEDDEEEEEEGSFEEDEGEVVSAQPTVRERKVAESPETKPLSEDHMKKKQ